MLPASHASCEAALRTLLRRTEALAEQSAPPSLQAFLADTAGLEYRKELFDESDLDNIFDNLCCRDNCYFSKASRYYKES